MAIKDLHDEPFDEATIAKLKLFEDYAQAWIPTFLMQRKVDEIHIFDFFSGPGYDKNFVSGSPIRILSKILEYKGYFFKNKVRIVTHFNEYEPKKVKQTKFEKLKGACTEFVDKNVSLKHFVTINYYNEDFEDLFPKLLPVLHKYPALVYIDQNGIKFLSDGYLDALSRSKRTDFLFFVSSSYIWRFGNQDEFKKHLDIDINNIKSKGYKDIHRSVTNEMRKKISVTSKLKLYPFSIKKGGNIYGIIFGATHPLAVDKFLSISWKHNTKNGDANFDIDDESGIQQLSLLEDRKLTKIEKFQSDVRELVLSRGIQNNFDLLEYTYGSGHIPKHAADCVKQLKKEGHLNFNGQSPLVTYDNVYKKKKRICFYVEEKNEWLKN